MHNDMRHNDNFVLCLGSVQGQIRLVILLEHIPTKKQLTDFRVAKTTK